MIAAIGEATARPGTVDSRASPRRLAAGAIGLVDLHEALDLLDRGRSSSAAVSLHHDRVERHWSIGYLQARGQVAQEAGKHRFDAEADDGVARTAHAQVADISGATRPH